MSDTAAQPTAGLRGALPAHATVHGLFLEAVAASPMAVAVEAEGEGVLTYAELDARSAALAAVLRARGVAPGVRVGVCLDRSLDLAVSLLAVLRAGGAYVPLDPAYPPARLELMLSDSQAPLVLAHAATLEQLPDTGAEVLAVDALEPVAAAPGPEAGPEDVAYVIYTSGSTGRPKGVVISHRALVNFLWSMAREPGLDANDTLVSVTTPCFDIFGLEIYLPLATGARVVLARRATTGDGAALAALLDAAGATVLQATPSTWRLLVDSGWPGRPGLRALCGGEALPPALAGELLARGLELWNMFGPTETTIWSTCARLESAEPPIPIGTPIANTTVYVVGEDGVPVAAGEEGELCIGGLGLAHGYFERPDLTGERFVELGGERVYRTGDLVRRREDGVLDYLGRLDHQVKIRGFRIELGEIEAALVRQEGIAQAVVVARPGPGGESQLVGYVVPADDRPADAPRLRRALTETLPDYMVPARVVSLEAMPLTPNGKVDRAALPAPTGDRGDVADLVAPRTELERRLVAIWEEALELRPIGVTDSIFDLGVSSLAAARLFTQIEHVLGDHLPLSALFQAPTIAALAEVVERGDGGRWTSLVPITVTGTAPPLFCVHGGAGTVLLLEPLARALGPEQPFYGLQSRGLYGRVAPLTTVEEMAAHYLAELRTVQEHGPYHLAGYCFGAIVAYEMARLLEAEGEEVALLASLNGPSSDWIRRVRRPLDDDRDPLAGFAGAGEVPPPLARLARALREPRRLASPVKRLARRTAVRFALATNRPLPEEARELFFLHLHLRSEQAYHGREYGGDIVVIHGQGLYDVPDLGWAPLTRGEVHSHRIAGEHTRNRQIMRAPYVDQVRDLLREHLIAGT